MRMLIIILMFFSWSVQANVAVDQINEILKKKEALQSIKSEAAKEIEDLRSNYYMVYIFKSTCPHCQKAAPILKEFSDAFNVKVRAYTIDNKSLPEFDSKPLTAKLYQIYFTSGGYKSMVPALYLVNKHTKQAYAAVFGEFNSYQLASRVHDLIKHIQEKYDA